jgi:hypothetical protein
VDQLRNRLNRPSDARPAGCPMVIELGFLSNDCCELPGQWHEHHTRAAEAARRSGQPRHPDASHHEAEQALHNMIDTIAETPFSAADSIRNDPGPAPSRSGTPRRTSGSFRRTPSRGCCSSPVRESASEPGKTGHVLLNLSISDSPERVATAFSSETHARLLELTARYDPHNLFRFAGPTR